MLQQMFTFKLICYPRTVENAMIKSIALRMYVEVQ